MLTTLLCALAAAVSLAAAEPAAEPAEAAPETHPLGWVLAPGDVHEHTVALQLDTRVTVRTSGEQEERTSHTTVSYRVRMLGLRRRSASETVVELAMRDFRLALTTETGSSALEVTMDDEGMTLRRDGDKAQRVPWPNVPRGRGAEVGELIHQPLSCTINRHASAIRIDRRMEACSQVLDSMDLTPLVLPPVPLPDTEVEAGATWTVTDAQTVKLSRPWGPLRLVTRTEVTLKGFEQHEGVTVARLAFKRATLPFQEQPRLSYELTIEGEVLVRLDGALVGGEAAVSVAASAAVVDSEYALTGTGTLRFGRPQASAPEEVSLRTPAAGIPR